MKDKVLILFGDGTQTPPMARSLYRKGYHVDAIFTSKLSYGYGSRYIKNKYLFEGETEDMPVYFAFAKNVLEKTKYVAAIPMHDESAELLSRYRDELLKLTRFEMPDLEVFERGFDKHKLMEVCQKNGYPHPETTIVYDGKLEDINIDNLHFPLLIKPNHTCGARGMTLCNSKKELEERFPKIYAEYGDCHLQRYVPMGGHQVELQLYVNADGELVQSSAIKKYRWYPENGGSSCCAVSAHYPEIIDILHKLLVKIGWVGFADFDTIEDPTTGELLIMEINPRVPACLKTTMAAGVDWGNVIISEYLGVEHKHYEEKDGVWLRHLGFEALWFAFSKNRWKTKPCWFNFIGRNIYYQDMSDWTDWMPFLRGSWGNLKKQLNPEFRKAKNGTR